MKKKFVQYYVEGADEEALLKVLKTEMQIIVPGKVQKLNAVEERISDRRLRTLSPGTVVVLVFDTDTGNVDILKENIDILKKASFVSEVVLVPQVSNLEDELIRSCDIRQIEELLNSKSKSDFKGDLIHVSNLRKKLEEHHFNFRIFWSETPKSPYQDIENQASAIKILK